MQQGGKTEREAEEELRGTFSKDKNEILFSRFGVNYNNEEEVWKKGSTVVREYEVGKPVLAGEVTAETEGEKVESRTKREKREKERRKAKVVVMHGDIIKDGFWDERKWILG